jgi:hypothetical protein
MVNSINLTMTNEQIQTWKANRRKLVGTTVIIATASHVLGRRIPLLEHQITLHPKSSNKKATERNVIGGH